MFANTFSKRRVLVTGHTGFKGSWLTQWLLKLGATVGGYALNPAPHQTLYDDLHLREKLSIDYRRDVLDYDAVRDALSCFQPEFVFHLAAQPLVRLSYDEPMKTFETNVMGTVHVLEALRRVQYKTTAIIVTTDKCYENREWLHAYREEDSLGGHDPYSASKGCAEIVTSAYRRSFFSKPSSNVSLASARAGNVIGGGDWAIDRIVPDIFRSILADQPVAVRCKNSTRPWQHVLEPLSGYLWLAACLDNSTLVPTDPKQLSAAFNFGPGLDSNRTVGELVGSILDLTKGSWVDNTDPNAPHEASMLNLAVDRAFHLLRWSPNWTFSETVEHTARWYEENRLGKSAETITSAQIALYEKDARDRLRTWAR